MLEGNSICDNFVQPLKASLLRLVILDGITILSRLEQPEKVSLVIVENVDGRLTFFRLEQFLYLQVTDYQLFMVNTVEKWIGFYL